MRIGEGCCCEQSSRTGSPHCNHPLLRRRPLPLAVFYHIVGAVHLKMMESFPVALLQSLDVCSAGMITALEPGEVCGCEINECLAVGVFQRPFGLARELATEVGVVVQREEAHCVVDLAGSSRAAQQKLPRLDEALHVPQGHGAYRPSHGHHRDLIARGNGKGGVKQLFDRLRGEGGGWCCPTSDSCCDKIR